MSNPHQRQLINQDKMRRKGNGRRTKRLEELVTPVSSKPGPARKIRVVFDDPDATDSSDDEMMEPMDQKRRVVYEMLLPGFIHASPQTQMSRPVGSEAPPSASGRRYRGVRQRKWGRWAAEIRDPIRGVKVWLGTYSTAEAAVEAYAAASVRLQAEKNGLRKASTPSSPDRSVSPLSHPSAASVLEAPTAAGSQLDGRHPPAGEARPLSEVFGGGRDQLGIPEMDFGLEEDAFLMGDLGGDFIGLDDLPLLGPEFDFLDDL